MNRPSPRLAILRAQLAAEADAKRMQRATYKISAAVGCSCPVPAPDADSLPLPPDYWSDLEHWLKTLAPAKPAAEQNEADKPTQQQAQKASTHLVCIEQHSCKVTGKKIPVGHISVLTEKQRPDCWILCNESGWVTHVPTADAMCPVPDGVKFEVRLRDRDLLCPSSNERLRSTVEVCWWRKGLDSRATECSADIIAWRPIAQS